MFIQFIDLIDQRLVLLLFALTKEVATLLSEAFANKADFNDELMSVDSLAMKKTYYALVRGYIDLHDKTGANAESGLIDYSFKRKIR